MKKSQPAASRLPSHRLVYALGALFITLTGYFDPALSFGLAVSTVVILAKV